MKNKLFNVLLNFTLIDYFIRLAEYLRGLYRYPNKMLGREFMHSLEKKSEVLVIAAHPDDEILGLNSTLCRLRKKNNAVKIAYVTNGSAKNGGSWKFNAKTSEQISQRRYNEAIQALSLIRMMKEDIICLGYPDSGTHRYLDKIANDVLLLIENTKPKKIYVHCIEGGHGDHDITSFVVRSVCKKVGFENIYEWAEYNPSQRIGTKDIRFISFHPSDYGEIKINITNEERNIKKKMLSIHDSQNVERFYMMGEALRKSNLLRLEEELIEHSKIPKKRLNVIMQKFSIHLDKNIRLTRTTNKEALSS